MEFKKPPNKKAQNPKPNEPNDQFAQGDSKPYDPSEVILIGREIGAKTSERVDSNAEFAERCTGRIRVRADFVDEVIIQALPKFLKDFPATRIPAVALIYAYGYEGHTYRLSKPCIMIVVGEGQVYAPSGQESAATITGELCMWRMSKLDTTLSIEVETGTLEKLILEGNQPGNRAVNSYSAHMQMSHRGGKLS